MKNISYINSINIFLYYYLMLYIYICELNGFIITILKIILSFLDQLIFKNFTLSSIIR